MKLLLVILLVGMLLVSFGGCALTENSPYQPHEGPSDEAVALGVMAGGAAIVLGVAALVSAIQIP